MLYKRKPGNNKGEKPLGPWPSKSECAPFYVCDLSQCVDRLLTSYLYNDYYLLLTLLGVVSLVLRCLYTYLGKLGNIAKNHYHWSKATVDYLWYIWG